MYGLDWQAGHAIVGEVLSSGGGTVTRRLTAVEGYLVAGMKVALDGEVYAGTPSRRWDSPTPTCGFPTNSGGCPHG